MLHVSPPPEHATLLTPLDPHFLCATPHLSCQAAEWPTGRQLGVGRAVVCHQPVFNLTLNKSHLSPSERGKVLLVHFLLLEGPFCQMNICWISLFTREIDRISPAGKHNRLTVPVSRSGTFRAWLTRLAVNYTFLQACPFRKHNSEEAWLKAANSTDTAAHATADDVQIRDNLRKH